jgi:lipoyl(octanoyl) transferase
MRLTRGVLQHVTALADAVIEVAGRHGVHSEFTRECPGVWVGRAKLAAFGVHVHHRVAIHGVALNVATALDHYDVIVPCGMRGSRPTSLVEQTGTGIEVASVVQPFAESFGRAIGRSIVFEGAFGDCIPDPRS